jgi:DNA-binding MarR family transcriptional regulator
MFERIVMNMSLSKSPQVTEIVDAFELISRSLRGQTVGDWVELDLTMAQLKALFTLEYGGAATIGHTAERLGISLPTASHLIDRLVQGGFVHRAEDPADRRRTVAAVTEKGSELTKRLRQGGRDSLVDWIIQMDDESISALAHGIGSLARIAASLDCSDLGAIHTANAQ